MTSQQTDGVVDPRLKLRKVEVDVLIPKKIREKAKILCDKEVAASLLDNISMLISTYNLDFTKCCQESSLAMVYKCRTENSALKACLTKHYQDKSLFEECKQEYLAEREEYRRTGVKQKSKRYPASM